MSDFISRQAAIDAINSMFAPTPTQMDMKEDCLEIIENLPSAQPTQTNTPNALETLDCVERQKAIDAVEHITSSMSVCVNTDECHGMKRMQRQAVIELANLPSAQPEPCDDAVSREAAIDVALSAFSRGLLASPDIRKLPSVQPEPQWIPVSEQLPEVGKDVMVCYDFKGHRSVLIGVLYGDEKFHGYDDEYLTPEGRKYRKAVAWMPLPEPYRAERRIDGRA